MQKEKKGRFRDKNWIQNGILFILLLLEMILFLTGILMEDLIYVFAALVTAVVSIILIFLFKQQTLNAQEYKKNLKESLVAPAEAQESPDSEEGTSRVFTASNEKKLDALGNMIENLGEIKEYYIWSKQQARSAFWLAVSMAVLGFFLLVAAVLLPIYLHTELALSIITAVGGVVTEVFAGTVLIIYQHSLKQLNFYYESLHENERILTAVNLLPKFSTTDQQDEMLREILRVQLHAEKEAE